MVKMVENFEIGTVGVTYLQVNKYKAFLRIVNKLWSDGKKVAGKPQLNRRSYNANVEFLTRRIIKIKWF